MAIALELIDAEIEAFHSNVETGSLDDKSPSDSMSSIKRDVKKKVPPRPDAEKIFVSTSSPLPVSVPPDSLERGSLWPVFHFRGFHLPVATTPIES
jgi:hypothetical protein